MTVPSRNMDMEALEGLKDVMGEEFPLLIETFFNDSIVRIEVIKASVSATDPDAIRRAAHSFKGSASNMGATLVTELCRQLEQMGLDGQTDGAASLLDQLIEEYEAVKEVLKAL